MQRHKTATRLRALRSRKHGSQTHGPRCRRKTQAHGSRLAMSDPRPFVHREALTLLFSSLHSADKHPLLRSPNPSRRAVLLRMTRTIWKLHRIVHKRFTTRTGRRTTAEAVLVTRRCMSRAVSIPCTRAVPPSATFPVVPRPPGVPEGTTTHQHVPRPPFPHQGFSARAYRQESNAAPTATTPFS